LTAPPSRESPSNLASFKVAAQSSTAVAVLVPSKTTEEELTQLINGIRKARTDGSLSQMIPPTTPGGSRGPYAIVAVFVMSDPAWATTPHLKSFINPTSAISAAEREFGKRILAYYYFTSLSNQEQGTIGYADEGHRYTTTFKKLF
jgi:hypothetical protein